MAASVEGRRTSAWTNMPGFSFASGLERVAWTRNVQVQATLSNPEAKLKPGMFVQAEVLLPSSEAVISLPASAINYAPYGDSVFVVADIKGPGGKTYRGVRQQIVKLGAARGDLISVVSGLEKDEEVVTSGVFKLRNGAPI